MKILINLTSTYKGGAEQVAASFLDECKLILKNEYIVCLRKNILSLIEKESFPNNFSFFEFVERPGKSLMSYFKVNKRLNYYEKLFNPDCVISTGGHGYWRPKAPLIAGYNIPHFVYNESPYFKTLSIKDRLLWKIKEKVQMFFYAKVDILFVQTEDVQRRLTKKLNPNKKIYVISNTVNGHFLNPIKHNLLLPPKKHNEVRLLMLSSYYPHKNHKFISEIIPILKKKLSGIDLNFVVSLHTEEYKALFGHCQENVLNVGKIPISKCPGLYQECDIMFLPSLLECFSASYIEAMLMKKPILTSDLEFARDVCKDAALYFNPTDVNSAIKAILELISNKKLQGKLILKGTAYAIQIGTPAKRALDIIDLAELTIQKNQ